MGESAKTSSIDFRRWILALIGFSCLLIWLIAYLSWGWDEVVRSVPVAIAGRVGLVIVALWLALPVIQPWFKYANSFIIGSLLLTLFVLAARPRIVPIVVGVLVVGNTVNWLLKMLSQKEK